MTQNKSSFVLSIRPKEYLKQGKTHCEVYTLKAVLSAYGKDTKKSPEEYHEFLLGKINAPFLHLHW